MKFTISTKNYSDQLMDWIKQYHYETAVERTETIGDSFVVTLNKPLGLSRNIPWLFEEIILEKNQVAGAHERLKDLLRAIVFEPGRKEIKKIFESYMKDSNTLNLEGFVLFRLGEYAALVNLVLYQAVKKMLY